MADSNRIRIARNTMFLYSRMFLIMLVSLYASRVTLRVLGVDDFGIYQTVAGAVTFLAFLSNSLGSGTSRFLTYEMGKENPRLSTLFSTVMVAHIVLGIMIVVVGEAVGLWFIYNKLVIPPERLDAAVFAFHFSMIGTFFQITQVPYNATIIAHEHMDVYAWISIYEAGIKVAVVFALLLFQYDKLEVYAVLMCLATISVIMVYRIYCRRKFAETRSKLSFDGDIFKEVAAFSGWHLLSSSGASLANQGVTIVTNMFFDPAVVTIRSLALRINDIINTFIGNFRTAVNPQIVKKYAAKDYEGSKSLALASTRYTFYLMLLIVLPLFLLVKPALYIWLGEIPDGLIPFVQLALIQGLFQSFDTSLYVPIYAKGRIKENAIISPLFDSLQLPLIYFLFKSGFAPVTLAWVSMFAYMGLGLIVKPLLVHFIVGYKLGEIIRMELRCLLVGAGASVIPVLVSLQVGVTTITGFLITLVVSLSSLAVFVWFLGLDADMRSFLLSWVKVKIWEKRL